MTLRFVELVLIIVRNYVSVQRVVRSGLAGISVTLTILSTFQNGGAQETARITADEPATVVFADAKLHDVLESIATAWTSVNGEIATIVFDQSKALVSRIEQGARADVFVSVDNASMDKLAQDDFVRPGTRRNVFGDALVLIEPLDVSSDLKIRPGFDLAGATGEGKIAVCADDACPAGAHTKDVLETLGVLANVEQKLVEVDDVGSVLDLVERGEARYGIVYASDAKVDANVRVVDIFPPATHSLIAYPASVVESSKNANAARFVAFLSSQAATKILLGSGYKVLSK
jgi:molybdate transport system substrate-binding protein